MDILPLALIFTLRTSVINRSVLNSAEVNRRNGNGGEGEEGIGSSCIIIAEGSHCSVAIMPIGSSTVEGSFGSDGIEGSLVSAASIGFSDFMDWVDSVGSVGSVGFEESVVSIGLDGSDGLEGSAGLECSIGSTFLDGSMVPAPAVFDAKQSVMMLVNVAMSRCK